MTSLVKCSQNMNKQDGRARARGQPSPGQARDGKPGEVRAGLRQGGRAAGPEGASEGAELSESERRRFGGETHSSPEKSTN